MIIGSDQRPQWEAGLVCVVGIKRILCICIHSSLMWNFLPCTVDSLDTGCPTFLTMKWYYLAKTPLSPKNSVFTVWCSIRCRYSPVMISATENTAEDFNFHAYSNIVYMAFWKQRTARGAFIFPFTSYLWYFFFLLFLQAFQSISFQWC